jgi:hypothetical protein
MTSSLRRATVHTPDLPAATRVERPLVQRLGLATDDGAVLLRRRAIAALFHHVWSRTQHALPPGSPDRTGGAAPTGSPTGGSAAAPIDLSVLDQSALPPVARAANLSSAAFVDGWIRDYCETQGTLDDLRPGSIGEQRVALILFMCWSTARLARSGAGKQHRYAEDLPDRALETILAWRAFTLGPAADGEVDARLHTEFPQDRYQRLLDVSMARAAIACHRLPGTELALVAGEVDLAARADRLADVGEFCREIATGTQP